MRTTLLTFAFLLVGVPAVAAPITLVNSNANNEPGYHSSNAIDGSFAAGNGWSGPNINSTGVLWVAETQTDASTTGGFRFQIHQLFTAPAQHLIRSFTISYTTDVRSTWSVNPNSATWTALTAPTIQPVSGLSFSTQPSGQVDTTPNPTVPNTAVYDLTYGGSYSGVTGFRLDVHYDNGITYGGYSGGTDFVVTEFQVESVAPAVPEPSSFLFALLALGGLGWSRRRSR